MKYEEYIEKNGLLLTKKFREKSDILDNVKKAKIRNKIESEVFDLHDAIADTTKIVFLVISMLKRMYEANFDTSVLSDDDKALIDYAFQVYSNTITRLDLQFQEEGGEQLIDKLLQRQQSIANIIQEEYNE